MHNQYRNIIVYTVVALLYLSCTRSIEGYVEDASTNRAFVPANFRVRTSQDTATFSWNLGTLASGKKYTYTVEVSTDSLFGKVDHKAETDTLMTKVLDPVLAINQIYFARLRVNEYRGAAPSRWVYAPTSFRVMGQQYLKVIRDYEVTESTLLLHWYVNAATTGINKVQISSDNGKSFVDITGAEAAAGAKLITTLTPGTRYTVQLMAGDKSKGIAFIQTSKEPVYAKTLAPGDDVAAALNAAVSGDVIGLQPGTHTLSSIYSVAGKNITLRATSNNPRDTKLKLRELNLVGDSAGITVMGIEVDGNYSGTSMGAVFVQLKGAGADGNAAMFKPVRFENCIIHNFTRCIVRGNFGSAANAHIIPSISVHNSIVYDINGKGTDTYYMFSLEKLLIPNIQLTKSTFYNLGAGMINMSTTILNTVMQVVLIDYCTFNNFGSQNKYLFIDGTNNKLDFNFRNSIVGNSPLNVTGMTINGTAFRATNTNSVLNFINNNYFKLSSAVTGGSKLVLNGLYQTENEELDLGWTSATADFGLQALAADNPLFKASTNGNTVGDPRWAY